MSDKEKAQVQKKRGKLRRKKKALEKESRHPEDALISTKATEQALLNATSDLAMITDTKGVILDISEAAALRVGIESNRLIGSCIYDFFQTEMVELRKAYVNIVVQSRGDKAGDFCLGHLGAKKKRDVTASLLTNTGHYQ